MRCGASGGTPRRRSRRDPLLPGLVKPLNAERARGLLAAMRGKRVLVLGDVMLDEFLWGRVARISPEAPVPVVEVSRQSFHVGGAGNVAGNVRSLGGEATVVGLVGRDVAGDQVREALVTAGVEDALARADGGRPTTVKTRIIAHHQQVVRADREVSDDATAELQEALFGRVRQALPACHALVLSDYQKGVLTAGLMKRVLPLARRRGVPVLVDPKVRHLPLYRGVTLLKPNTDDMREAPSRVVIGELAERGATVVAYDPAAMTESRRVFGEAPWLDYAESPMDALTGADALLIVTEWKEFRSPDFAAVKASLKQPVIFDGRNLYDPEFVAGFGVEYHAVGRGRG